MSSYSQHARDVSDILLQQGSSKARAARAKGEFLGNTLASLGNLPQIVQAKQREERELARRDALDKQRAEVVGLELESKRAELDQDKALRTAMQGGGTPFERIKRLEEAGAVEQAMKLRSAYADEAAKVLRQANAQNWNSTRQAIQLFTGQQDETNLPVQYPGDEWKRARMLEHADLKTYLDQTKPYEQKNTLMNVGPGGVIFDPVTKQPVYSNETSRPATPTNPTEASLALAAANGDEGARRALQFMRQQHQSSGGGAEPLVAVMKDGKPVLVRRSQAEGLAPASSREQGRAVTSGDAGRVADLNTSLDDLDVLTKTVPAGATGTAAKVGAMLPNSVTELTGWGADAKTKQAVIDRVKQVIGKALEGGVLRKEDEYKYEKILPTIGDVDSVVKSKLEGLKSAIEQRRSTFLDSLADSGYDVSSHVTRTQNRTPPPPGGAPKDGATKPIPGYPGTEQTYRNGKWIRTK